MGSYFLGHLDGFLLVISRYTMPMYICALLLDGVVASCTCSSSSHLVSMKGDSFLQHVVFDVNNLGTYDTIDQVEPLLLSSIMD